MATTGICASRASAGSLSALMAPSLSEQAEWARRMPRMELHAVRLATQIQCASPDGWVLPLGCAGLLIMTGPYAATTNQDGGTGRFPAPFVDLPIVL
jgi:hypothetical protein